MKRCRPVMPHARSASKQQPTALNGVPRKRKCGLRPVSARRNAKKRRRNIAAICNRSCSHLDERKQQLGDIDRREQDLARRERREIEQSFETRIVALQRRLRKA